MKLVFQMTALFLKFFPEMPAARSSAVRQTIQQRHAATLILLCTSLCLMLLLSACATTEEKDPKSTWPAPKLYEEAERELKNGDYELAIEYLETLESRFPFGKYAPQAQLETAYAYYKFGWWATTPPANLL